MGPFVINSNSLHFYPQSFSCFKNNLNDIIFTRIVINIKDMKLYFIHKSPLLLVLLNLSR